MDKIITGAKYSEPLGIKQIIKGIRHDITHPVTKKVTTVGDGEILYDIGMLRDSHFILAYQKNHLN